MLIIFQNRGRKIKQHMRQLKSVLANGVIYAFQFGWIGTWGEQHGSCYTDQQKQAIYRTFYADFMPANRKITMRYKANRDMLINALSPLLDSDTLRIGFNNDYYTLDAHKFAVGNDFVWQSAVYNDLKKLAQTLSMTLKCLTTMMVVITGALILFRLILAGERFGALRNWALQPLVLYII